MFGSKLKDLRKRAGLSQEELAKKLGISKSTIGMYEQGQRKKPQSDEVLKSIADFFGVSLDYLMGYEGSGLTAEDMARYNLRPIATKKIPMLGSIPCGVPTMCEQDFETFIEVSDSINADFCLTAKGDSMINARILDGDVVFIREQSTVENGEIAAVLVNDNEVTLKRFYYYPELQQIILYAENPKYQPMVYEGEALGHIRVLGKAVMFTSRIA
ncbi:MAG: S24 family peptidase [Clostridiales bacterium]|nr:S24 family peptidase [Clostridiales bacterium]